MSYQHYAFDESAAGAHATIEFHSLAISRFLHAFLADATIQQRIILGLVKEVTSFTFEEATWFFHYMYESVVDTENVNSIGNWREIPFDIDRIIKAAPAFEFLVQRSHLLATGVFGEDDRPGNEVTRAVNTLYRERLKG